MTTASLHYSTRELRRFAATPTADARGLVLTHVATCALCAFVLRQAGSRPGLRYDTGPVEPGDPVCAAQHRIACVPGERTHAHLVCGVGRYELTLLVETDEDHASVRMRGQVMVAGSLNDVADGISVALEDTLSSAHVEAVEARTSALGEFELEAPVSGDFRLRVGEGSDARCVFVWEGRET